MRAVRSVLGVDGQVGTTQYIREDRYRCPCHERLHIHGSNTYLLCVLLKCEICVSVLEGDPRRAEA